MSDKIINIIYSLLKEQNLYNYDNDINLKDAKISMYYDIENNKHIKIDLGYESYIISID